MLTGAHLLYNRSSQNTRERTEVATDSSIYLKYIKEYSIEEKSLLLELLAMEKSSCE